MEMIARDEVIAMVEDMEGRRDEDGYIRVYKLDVIANLRSLPSIDLVTCGECIHFHYDKPYIIQGIPVLGHEVCDFWGDGCKTNLNGFCSYGERREDL